jgi:hypothetical protein
MRNHKSVEVWEKNDETLGIVSIMNAFRLEWWLTSVIPGMGEGIWKITVQASQGKNARHDLKNNLKQVQGLEEG